VPTFQAEAALSAVLKAGHKRTKFDTLHCNNEPLQGTSHLMVKAPRVSSCTS
jgi:hypothetical protein